MKNSFSKSFKCLKCFLIFYLVFTSIFEIAVAVFGLYLLIFHEEGRIPASRNVVLYFFLDPALSILTTILAWWAIKKKNAKLLKLFAVLLAVAFIVEISGCVWCFVSLPKVNQEVKSHLKMQYESMSNVNSDKTWWNNLQSKHKCCGLYGLSDYRFAESVPLSCCGNDPEDHKSGSCTFLWQRGCINAVEKEINNDLITLSLMVLCIAFLRIPGVILSWRFAQKMSRERL